MVIAVMPVGALVAWGAVFSVTVMVFWSHGSTARVVKRSFSQRKPNIEEKDPIVQMFTRALEAFRTAHTTAKWRSFSAYRLCRDRNKLQTFDNVRPPTASSSRDV